MKTAALLFAAILALPTPRFVPDGGEPVPVIYEWDAPAAEVWQVEVPDVPEGDVRVQVWVALGRLGRSESERECALAIFERESSMNPEAVGDQGRSFGLGQRHAPANGMPPLPWPVADQAEWFDGYAHDRYGGWCEAHDRWFERAAKRGGKGWW